MSLVCRRNTYLWQHPQIIVQRCRIAAPNWPNDISSAADNAIFKNKAQNIECSFDCVARSAVCWKQHFFFNFCEQKFVQHGPIMIAIDYNGLSLRIVEEKWPNYASGQNPHKTVTRFGCFGFSMYACGFSVPQMLQFCLFTYLPRSKWASSEEMIFFAKIDIFCKSISGPLSEAYISVYTTIFVRRIS